MIKLIARPELLSKLHIEERLIKAIQLLRIIGAIRYNNILQVKLMRDPDYNVAHHIHLLNIHAASLYEGIKTFCKLCRSLKDMEYYQNNQDKLKLILRENGNASSFCNQVLKPIRNGIAFHFEEDVIRKNLKDYIEFCIHNNMEVILVSGESELMKDTTYGIADNVTINFVLDRIAGKDLPVEEKVERFSKELLKLTSTFLEILDNIVGELLEGYGVAITN